MMRTNLRSTAPMHHTLYKVLLQEATYFDQHPLARALLTTAPTAQWDRTAMRWAKVHSQRRSGSSETYLMPRGGAEATTTASTAGCLHFMPNPLMQSLFGAQHQQQQSQDDGATMSHKGASKAGNKSPRRKTSIVQSEQSGSAPSMSSMEHSIMAEFRRLGQEQAEQQPSTSSSSPSPAQVHREVSKGFALLRRMRAIRAAHDEHTLREVPATAKKAVTKNNASKETMDRKVLKKMHRKKVPLNNMTTEAVGPQAARKAIDGWYERTAPPSWRRTAEPLAPSVAAPRPSSPRVSNRRRSSPSPSPPPTIKDDEAASYPPTLLDESFSHHRFSHDHHLQQEHFLTTPDIMNPIHDCIGVAINTREQYNAAMSYRQLMTHGTHEALTSSSPPSLLLPVPDLLLLAHPSQLCESKQQAVCVLVPTALAVPQQPQTLSKRMTGFLNPAATNYSGSPQQQTPTSPSTALCTVDINKPAECTVNTVMGTWVPRSRAKAMEFLGHFPLYIGGTFHSQPLVLHGSPAIATALLEQQLALSLSCDASTSSVGFSSSNSSAVAATLAMEDAIAVALNSQHSNNTIGVQGRMWAHPLKDVLGLGMKQLKASLTPTNCRIVFNHHRWENSDHLVGEIVHANSYIPLKLHEEENEDRGAKTAVKKARKTKSKKTATKKPAASPVYQPKQADVLCIDTEDMWPKLLRSSGNKALMDMARMPLMDEDDAADLGTSIVSSWGDGTLDDLEIDI